MNISTSKCISLCIYLSEKTRLSCMQSTQRLCPTYVSAYIGVTHYLMTYKDKWALGCSCGTPPVPPTLTMSRLFHMQSTATPSLPYSCRRRSASMQGMADRDMKEPFYLLTYKDKWTLGYSCGTPPVPPTLTCLVSFIF